MRAGLVAVPVFVAMLVVPAVAATPAKLTSRGVDGVKLGAKHSVLRDRGLLGRKTPGCEFDGPDARAAKLRIDGVKGIANLTQDAPRRVDNVQLRAGARAKGVGFGDRRADVKAAFPHVRFIKETEEPFGITVAEIPARDGGPFQMGIDVDTKRITAMGVPFILFCE
jgi:hypothetical protein